ncbi:hypothetical protein [Candidatus Ichthyocystis hellenicum]|uniref:hypothetical protein n=1 Tax=Candidatus Ichthyocystis hellenicum TaxID=1561003 RepID=UPI000B861663|nr:hypothetical protein [Candidatus Ichthyocystis hellenicum]
MSHSNIYLGLGNQIFNAQLLNEELQIDNQQNCDQNYANQDIISEDVSALKNIDETYLWGNVTYDDECSHDKETGPCQLEQQKQQEPCAGTLENSARIKDLSEIFNDDNGGSAEFISTEKYTDFDTDQTNNHPWENMLCESYELQEQGVAIKQHKQDQQKINCDICIIKNKAKPDSSPQEDKLNYNKISNTISVVNFPEIQYDEITSEDSSTNSEVTFHTYYGAKIDSNTAEKINFFRKKLLTELQESIKEATYRLKNHFSKNCTKSSPTKNMLSMVDLGSDEVFLDHLSNFSNNYSNNIKETLGKAKIFDGKSERSMLPEEKYLIFCCFRRENAINTKKEIKRKMASGFPELSEHANESTSSTISSKKRSHEKYLCTNVPSNTTETDSNLQPSVPKEDYIFSNEMLSTSCINAVINITDNIEKYEIDYSIISSSTDVLTEEEMVTVVGKCISASLESYLDDINVSINTNALCKIDKADSFLIKMLSTYKKSKLIKQNGIWGKIFTPQVYDQLEAILCSSLEKYDIFTNNDVCNKIIKLYVEILTKNPKIIVEELVDVVKQNIHTVRKLFFTELCDDFFISRISAHKVKIAKDKIGEMVLSDKNLNYLFEVMLDEVTLESCCGEDNIEAAINKFSKDFFYLLEIICSQYTGRIYLILRDSPVIAGNNLVWLDSKQCMDTSKKFIANIINLRWLKIKELCKKQLLKTQLSQ